MKNIYPIVGMKHRGAEAERIVREIRVGAAVQLRRDKENRFDSNAVAVYVGEEHVGFVPAPMAARLAPSMDAHGRLAMDGEFVATSDRRPAVQITEEDAQ